MALYDDLDTKQKTDKIDGWASGIKLLQSQLALKKTNVTIPRRDPPRKSMALPPVIDLKSKKELYDDDIYRTVEISKFKPQIISMPTVVTPSSSNCITTDYDWDVIDEYDPLWPNDYEKLVKEKRDERDKLHEENPKRPPDIRKRGRGGGVAGNMIKFGSTVGIGGGSGGGGGGVGGGGGGGGGEDTSPPVKSGFCGRPQSDEEEFSKSPTSGSNAARPGAAIAPPPSLQEDMVTINTDILKGSLNLSAVSIPYGASSVAAKIMARYGFKDGQGLGKQEQGMSMALQVEKTSKRGGRIIHEKELILPPPPPPVPPVPNPTAVPSVTEAKFEPSITEIMKAPSKVVLLRNMVGPGDVDNELEPEVKDECNSKYGEVIKVVIHEFPDAVAEEAVRIFVEFKRIESAIKAVVDLNGRFFGGRQVRAGFYNLEKFQMLMLTD